MFEDLIGDVKKEKEKYMWDCKGNKFYVGDEFASIETVHKDPLVRCIKIEGGMATFEWIRPGALDDPYKMSQKRLDDSKWVVV